MSSPERDILLCETEPRATERDPELVATERASPFPTRHRIITEGEVGCDMQETCRKQALKKPQVLKRSKWVLTYGQPDLPAACNAETQPEQWHTGPWWQLSQHKARGEK